MWFHMRGFWKIEILKKWYTVVLVFSIPLREKICKIEWNIHLQSRGEMMPNEHVRAL